MPRIKTKEMLDRLAAGEFNMLKLKGLQSGSFYMLLECNDGVFIHENLDDSMKEYRKSDDALNWLKRKTEIKEIVINIEIWNDDKAT